MIAYYRPLLYASAWQVASWLVALACAVRLRPDWATGVFWGGLVMAINFSLLRFVAHLWHRHGGLSRGVATLLAAKMFFLSALVGAIFYWAKPDGAGMAIGMGTLFVGVLGATLHKSHASRLPPPPFVRGK